MKKRPAVFLGGIESMLAALEVAAGKPERC